MVYKSSPTQRAPSEPPEAAPSLSGRQLSADEETLRQRLISAVQRPSGAEKAGQLAETFSLRSAPCFESHKELTLPENCQPCLRNCFQQRPVATLPPVSKALMQCMIAETCMLVFSKVCLQSPG